MTQRPVEQHLRWAEPRSAVGSGATGIVCAALLLALVTLACRVAGLW